MAKVTGSPSMWGDRNFSHAGRTTDFYPQCALSYLGLICLIKIFNRGAVTDAVGEGRVLLRRRNFSPIEPPVLSRLFQNCVSFQDWTYFSGMC